MRTASLPPLAVALAALAAVLPSSCSVSAKSSADAYAPALPTSWAGAVTNPYFPLVPGTRWEYAGETDGGVETIVVEVLHETRTVNGVTATVVRDRVYVGGQLAEDTDDWFAQDAAGSVWYLGEDSKEVEAGRVVGTEGSWEWGRDGALPGIIMWANPAEHVGESYRQEYLEGEAEDWGRVVALAQTVTVLAGTYTNCIRTEDWNALERNSLELKTYCPGVGVVLEATGSGRERVRLRSMAAP